MSGSQGFAILEGREASGGTWDLFRYPGVRSDSDMYTLGLSPRPWKEAKVQDRRRPVDLEVHPRSRERSPRIDGKIRYRHKVVGASWSTPEARWTVDLDVGPSAIAGK